MLNPQKTTCHRHSERAAIKGSSRESQITISVPSGRGSQSCLKDLIGFVCLTPHCVDLQFYRQRLYALWSGLSLKQASVMISYISYTDTHKDTLISHLFITQWMLLPREQFSSLATEREKGWNKMTRSSSEAKFSFNRELHLVVKSASLTALKHEVLNPPRQNSTGTSQPSW